MPARAPPNGGWGWIIVIAFALNSIATVPIVQGFGLLFKDSLGELGLSATDTSVIINVNMSFGTILGIVNGPLLRHFGYRKIAIAGSVVYSVGVTLLAFANSFATFVITYGILASIGMGMGMSAFSLALNTYFSTKRSRAMGLAMTLVGLGPIFMPQLISTSLSFYGLQGTILLFGSYSLHSLVGAMLLRPVKWHQKKVNSSSEQIDKDGIQPARKVENTNAPEDSEKLLDSAVESKRYQRERKTTISSIDHDVEVGSIYGFDTPLPRQLSETIRARSYEKSIDVMTYGSSMTNLPEAQIPERSEYTWWSSANSLRSAHLASSVNIFNECPAYERRAKKCNSTDAKQPGEICQDSLDDKVAVQKKVAASIPEEEICNDLDDNKYKSVSPIKRVFRRIVVFYDLDLLRDPIYVNIMMGTAIAIFAEINFSLLTPFILSDMGLATGQIANVMSVIGTVDLVCRGAAPFIGEWLRQTPRNMYLISLCLLILSRTSLLFVNDLTSMFLVAVGLGAAKGIRSVYMSLVVPSHVPLHRLPYASGIQMMVNGFFLMVAGPFLGVIRDATGSYMPCIVIINIVTGITVTMWLTEMLIFRLKRRKGIKLDRQDSSFKRSET